MIWFLTGFLRNGINVKAYVLKVDVLVLKLFRQAISLLKINATVKQKKNLKLKMEVLLVIKSPFQWCVTFNENASGVIAWFVVKGQTVAPLCFWPWSYLDGEKTKGSNLNGTNLSLCTIKIFCRNTMYKRLNSLNRLW